MPIDNEHDVIDPITDVVETTEAAEPEQSETEQAQDIPTDSATEPVAVEATEPAPAIEVDAENEDPVKEDAVADAAAGTRC